MEKSSSASLLGEVPCSEAMGFAKKNGSNISLKPLDRHMREIRLDERRSSHRAIGPLPLEIAKRAGFSTEYKARASLLTATGPSELLRNASQTQNGNSSSRTIACETDTPLKLLYYIHQLLRFGSQARNGCLSSS